MWSDFNVFIIIIISSSSSSIAVVVHIIIFVVIVVVYVIFIIIIHEYENMMSTDVLSDLVSLKFVCKTKIYNIYIKKILICYFSMTEIFYF